MANSDQVIRTADIVSKEAIYFEQADHVDYVAEEGPCVYVRVDEFLSLVYPMFDRQRLIGFRLKGFRHFYETNFMAAQQVLGHDFVTAVAALERAVTRDARHGLNAAVIESYRAVLRIADRDMVKVYGLKELANAAERHA